jgi:hypothetical protein
MNQLQRFSEAVYEGMCFTAGTPNEVAIRRDVEEIHELVLAPLQKKRQIRTIKSGSYKEGFRLKGSDIDQMFWLTNHRLIWNLGEADDFNTSSDAFVLLNWNSQRPGFVFLQLLTPTQDSYVSRSIFRMNDNFFISSLLYRESTLQWIRPNTTVHGPCANEKDGNVEWDRVHCFVCKHWPPFAFPFIERCLSSGWPRPDALNKAVDSGVQVVPIGLKGSEIEDYEWRLSFCTAEQKLVQSLNHAQFMCFGLLKLLIKEIVSTVDENGESPLCSFFVKTVLFWTIQNKTSLRWTPSDFLTCFWNCMKYLLHCVYRGYLPNFFLPENNLFITKVRGRMQQELFEDLYKLYGMGFPCLIYSKTLRAYLNRAFSNLEYIPSTNEEDFVSEVDEDKALFYEIGTHDAFNTYCSDIHESVVLLNGVCSLDVSILTPYQYVALEKFVSSILRYLAYHIHDIVFSGNKERYIIEKLCEKLLIQVAKLGWASDILYVPMYLCKNDKRKTAVHYLEIAKLNLSKSYVMYRGEFDRESYFANVVDQPLSVKRGKAAFRDIRVERVVIRELELEEQTSRRFCLYVHPRVMLNMLLVLCHRDDQVKQQEALHDLCDFLQDDESRIPVELKEISWEILGICQQICGDYPEALMSYEMSLSSDYLFHDFGEATLSRIKETRESMLH